MQSAKSIAYMGYQNHTANAQGSINRQSSIISLIMTHLRVYTSYLLYILSIYYIYTPYDSLEIVLKIKRNKRNVLLIIL